MLNLQIFFGFFFGKGYFCSEITIFVIFGLDRCETGVFSLLNLKLLFKPVSQRAFLLNSTWKPIPSSSPYILTRFFSVFKTISCNTEESFCNFCNYSVFYFSAQIFNFYGITDFYVQKSVFHSVFLIFFLQKYKKIRKTHLKTDENQEKCRKKTFERTLTDINGH